CPHRAVLRTTNGKGIRRGSRACSLLPARASRNLSARAVIGRWDVRNKMCLFRDTSHLALIAFHYYFLPIFGGRSHRSFPSSDSGSMSSSATPALESLSDA